MNYAWLSQVLFFEVFRTGAALAGGDQLHQLAGGTDALRFLHSLLVTARLALLYWAFLRLSRSSTLAAFGIAFIVLVSGGNPGIMRPQVVGELLFAALLVPMARPQLSRRAVALIPFLMVLWANAHGSYPLGFVVLGGVLLGRAITVVAGAGCNWRRLAEDVAFRRLLLALLASLVAVALLNPKGVRIFAVTLEMANHPNVRAMDEWQPIYAPIEAAVGARYALGACLLVVFAAFATARGSFRAETWILLALFGIPAVMTQRSVVWLITAVVWITLPYFGAALARSHPRWWTSVPSLRKTLVIIAITFLGLAWSIPAQRWFDRKPLDVAASLSEGTPWQFALSVRDPALQSADSPLNRILTTYPQGRFTGSIFTSETLGDFFLWECPRETPVFIYSHVHLFTPEHWQRYNHVRAAGPRWRDILDAARVNLIVVAAEQCRPLCEKLRTDPDWKVLLDEAGSTNKRDPRCRLFAAVRKIPR